MVIAYIQKKRNQLKFFVEKFFAEKIVQFIKTLLLLMDDTKLKIEEIEVNPLFVYKNQVKAIDALISVGS